MIAYLCVNPTDLQSRLWFILNCKFIECTYNQKMVFTYIFLYGICISYVNNRICGVIVSAHASSSVDQAPIGLIAYLCVNPTDIQSRLWFILNCKCIAVQIQKIKEEKFVYFGYMVFVYLMSTTVYVV
jgi:hypothetical protein